MDSEVVKYLNKYHIDRYELKWEKTDNYSSVVVIPAIKEYKNIKGLLYSLTQADPTYFSRTLFIFVINNILNCAREIKEDNLMSIHLMDDILNKKTDDSLVDNVLNSGVNIGYIDASTPGNELSEKDGGVGMARKIGMDVALKILNYNTTNPKLLICLDADCTVETNYLSEIHTVFSSKDVKAASINFEHHIKDSDEADKAITCYEIFLRYYVAGLRFAGSKYAFHTIGSAMVCNHESYIKAEGMNKRKAAEDFYFLEKISKNTKILNISGTTVYPSGRKSWRVPFGTGQRITRFHAGTHNEFLLYSPLIFEVLKEWLHLFHGRELLNPDEYLYHAGKINFQVHNFLITQNFLQDMGKIISTSKTDEQIKKQQFRWFDGFRTLKLVHYLRDNGMPNIFILDALNIMFEKLNLPSVENICTCVPDQRSLFSSLRILRKIDKEDLI